MKTILLFEGQKKTIQGESKPTEAMEIMGLNPKEWKVVKRAATNYATIYTIERKAALYVVPKIEDAPAVTPPPAPAEPVAPWVSEEEIIAPSSAAVAAIDEILSMVPASKKAIKPATPSEVTAALRCPAPETTHQWAPCEEIESRTREAIAALNGTIDPAAPGFTFTHASTGVVLNNIDAAPAREVVTVTVPRPIFLEALSVCADIAAGKTTLPILSFAHLTVYGGSCVVTATDLSVSYRVKIPCEATGDVCACIPIRLTLQEVKALPKAITSIVLAFDGNTVGMNGRVRLNTVDSDEYPEVLDAQGDIHEITGLSDALRHVFPAISDDESRYVLTGAYVDSVTGHVCGTDGFRLHVDEISSGTIPAFCVPKYVVKLCLKHAMKDEVRLHRGDTLEKISLFVKGGELTTRLISGAYPDYLGYIPKDNAISVMFSSDDFFNVLSGTDPVTTSAITLNFTDCLNIGADGDGGSYRWQIPCTNTAGETTRNFNPKFLVDAIRTYHSDTVLIEIPDNNGAVVINRKAVVMPIRL